MFPGVKTVGLWQARKLSDSVVFEGLEKLTKASLEKLLDAIKEIL